MLERRFGYTKGLDLGAITYDWRRGPTYDVELFPHIQAEIERLYGSGCVDVDVEEDAVGAGEDSPGAASASASAS